MLNETLRNASARSCFFDHRRLASDRAGSHAQKKEESVRSGINEKYIDPKLKVGDCLTFIGEVKVEGLKENYFLRLRKGS